MYNLFYAYRVPSQITIKIVFTDKISGCSHFVFTIKNYKIS
nr:MAG TPA: hypothetical protein [Caudoviricetes sp.]